MNGLTQVPQLPQYKRVQGSLHKDLIILVERWRKAFQTSWLIIWILKDKEISNVNIELQILAMKGGSHWMGKHVVC